MGKMKNLAVIVIIIFFSLFLIPGYASADRGTVQLIWDSLGYSTAGVQIAPDGSIFVLDQENEIWKIDPSTGDYEGYWAISDYELSDMALKDSETVWWTDGSQMFGFLVMGTGEIKFWDTYDVFTNNPQFGPLVYEQGSVWLADSLSSYNGIYHFNPQSDELCMYKNMSSGIHAADLVMLDEDVWALDWFLNSLMRFDPDSGVWTRFDIGREIGLNGMLQTDGSYLWAAEDVDDGAILRFDPASLALTVYHLPDGEQPLHFVLQGDQAVWYTNYNGSFGKIDLKNFTDVETSMLTDSPGGTVTPSCADLGSPDEYTAGLDTGTLNDPPSYFVSTVTSPKTGLQSFSLDSGATPFGIAATHDFIWITDPARDELIRLPLESQSDESFIFLPLIIK